MLDMPFTAVSDFIKRQRTIGKYKKNTALAREAACALIGSILEPGHDSVGYVKDHLDDLVKRYGNLNPNASKASIDTYRSRVERAIEDFIGHKTDANWQPRSRARRGEASPSAATTPSGTPLAKTINEIADELFPKPAAANALRHRFPLRPDFDVEVLLPRDFTSKEAKRVTGWISALASAFSDEGAE
jgi:hypothetical protein